MRFERFRVTNYRNVIDSGWIDVSQVTAFVGQNESGKSNLFEALYRVNPFVAGETYNLDEDWPADDWSGRDPDSVVCEALFVLEDQAEISDLFDQCAQSPLWDRGDSPSEPASEAAAEPRREEPEPAAEDPSAPSSEQSEASSLAATEPVDVLELTSPLPPPRPAGIGESGLPRGLPARVEITARRRYVGEPEYEFSCPGCEKLVEQRVKGWISGHLPKFVYVAEYELSGAQSELDQLAQRLQAQGWGRLSAEDQTNLIVLELANIDIKDFLEKGSSSEGRTLRSFDKRQASAYLTRQFARLWRQKKVRFDIDVDATTLNIFAEDEGLGMPVRLARRSTGFRWYVSFAWKFTHASKGQYKNCIVLLEEPGIHLHPDGQRDLLELFEVLSAENVILYTTHLSSLIDPAHPERVRIVEVRDHHANVVHGVVSDQRPPMAVIESRLGLSGDPSAFLDHRHSLIVEGGDAALLIRQLSDLLERSGKEGLSNRVHIWTAESAAKMPMFVSYLLGRGCSAAVLLDSDSEGQSARSRIESMDFGQTGEGARPRILMLADAMGVQASEVGPEDLFPVEFYLDCVNKAYGLALQATDLPVDGSPQTVDRVARALRTRYGRDGYDKLPVLLELRRRFEGWKRLSEMPESAANRAERLIKSINRAFT